MTQKDALNILKLGHTTFLSGEAGSGKSYVLKQFVDFLKKHDITHQITATTGIAASHVGGVTIHSFSGLGIRESISEYEADEILGDKKKRERLENIEVLIIDEISMAQAGLIDALNILLKQAKKSSKPFGGTQIVFCGDFFQLPPIGKRGSNALYAFQSDAWKEANPVICYLGEQHRQEDGELYSVLKAIRDQTLEEDGAEPILSRLNAELEKPHTMLYTHNVDVDKINKDELFKIGGLEYHFQMVTRGSKKRVESLTASILAEEKLILKEGALVMFIRNDKEKKYVNGSTGVVVEFNKKGDPVVELLNGKRIECAIESWKMEEDGKVLAEVSQYPLKLAWAITIHKSQGMTLDRAVIDLSRAFGYGMGYVALSRVKSLSGLCLLGISNQAFLMHPEVTRFDEDIKRRSKLASTNIKKYTDEELSQMIEQNISNKHGSIEEVEVVEETEVVTKKKEPKPKSFTVTHELLKEGKTIKEIMQIRGVVESTIISHIEDIVNLLQDKSCIKHILPKQKIQDEIKEALEKNEGLKAVYEALKGKHDYHTIKIVRAYIEE